MCVQIIFIIIKLECYLWNRYIGMKSSCVFETAPRIQRVCCVVFELQYKGYLITLWLNFYDWTHFFFVVKFSRATEPDIAFGARLTVSLNLPWILTWTLHPRAQNRVLRLLAVMTSFSFVDSHKELKGKNFGFFLM